MALFNVRTNGTITVQKGKPRNTIGYSGNAWEQYKIDYSVNSQKKDMTLHIFRRLLGR